MDINYFSDIVDRAIVFATDAHSGTCRKGNDLPYIVHPLEVCAIAAAITNDRNVMAAALLHDTVEDTEYTIEDIKHFFGEDVAMLVASDSENKREELPPSETWLIRKQETIAYLKETASYREKIIVLSDKLSNIRSIYRDQKEIGDNLWQRFNQKDKSMHEWYYRSIAENLKEFENTCAYTELIELIEKVFSE